MYNHYIAVDWAQTNMAIARMTKESKTAKVINVPSDLKELKLYLSRLRGSKILTFEETTTSQWLYVELKDCVDEILICDPYRNHLLSEGAKTDKLDAEKLVQLLRSELLKPVFHKADVFIRMRKLVSGYEDRVKAGVRLKNQRSALFRAQGMCKKGTKLKDPVDRFVLEGLDQGIASYELEKKRYETEMQRLRKKYCVISHLDQIFGIGSVGAVKIVARVVDGKRFKDKGSWLSYCGLVRHEKLSGARSYGWKKPRYCRMMKNVFKTAALSCTATNARNLFKDYYDFLIHQKGYGKSEARNATARRIAIIALGVMKSGKPFDEERHKILKK